MTEHRGWHPTAREYQQMARMIVGGTASSGAVTHLRATGHHVEPAGDIPGLWMIDGREVTSGQLLDIAARGGLDRMADQSYGPLRVMVDQSVPPGEIEFRDESGKLVGRIINIGIGEGAGK